MARPTEGFRLRPHPITGIQQVRFTHEGHQGEYSTGERDPVAAAKEGARIYAEVISGRWVPGTGQGIRPATPLVEVAAKWIDAIASTLDEKTVEQYEMYAGTHWMPFFGSLDRMVTPSIVDYTRARLGMVQRNTVKKELSAMRGFLAFCQEKPICNPPVHVPSVPKKSTGTVADDTHKREPVPLEPHEVAKIIAGLPKWSAGRTGRVGFVVRAYFIVAWETGLRPATLAELETPGDYRRGGKTLQIRDEIDKARFGRLLPVTKKACAALDSAISGDGLIFGSHDYRDYLKPAAQAAGIERWEEVSPYDFRHARGTHLVETSGNLPGVAFLFGHKHVTTTNRYVHPSLKAAERVLASAAKRGK